MAKKRALVTGISGQCGSYLAEQLLERGYEVWGSIRRTSGSSTGRIDHIIEHLNLLYADLTDADSLDRLVRTSMPDEIFNLAAQSHVAVSFEMPEYTTNTNALGVCRLLEAVRVHVPEARLYQASTSEMFGSTPPLQNESSLFHPRSPYAASKVYSYHAIINYRESYNLFACNGILFNTESPRRGETFVTKKIVQGAVDVYRGTRGVLKLGNLDAKRDWGYAPEYTLGMQKILQQNKPDDYVLATGETHTVAEFCQEAFGYFGLDYKNYVEVDDSCKRPAEVDVLQGDASKAKRVLGWEPKVRFKELVKIMVEAELEETR